MNPQESLTIAQSRPLYLNIVFTAIAIGLGVTVPKIFHLFGLGPAFLPMFLPVILLGLLTSYGYVFAAAIITPLLSYSLTGMPPAPIAMHMTVQLAVLGSLVILFTRNLKINYIYAIPAAIIAERVLSLIAASAIGSEHITTGAILGSYPGMIMLAVVSIIVMKLYDR
jgi:hypothetical protein